MPTPEDEKTNLSNPKHNRKRPLLILIGIFGGLFVGFVSGFLVGRISAPVISTNTTIPTSTSPTAEVSVEPSNLTQGFHTILDKDRRAIFSQVGENSRYQMLGVCGGFGPDDYYGNSETIVNYIQRTAKEIDKSEGFCVLKDRIKNEIVYNFLVLNENPADFNWESGIFLGGEDNTGVTIFTYSGDSSLRLFNVFRFNAEKKTINEVYDINLDGADFFQRKDTDGCKDGTLIASYSVDCIAEPSSTGEHIVNEIKSGAYVVKAQEFTEFYKANKEFGYQYYELISNYGLLIKNDVSCQDFRSPKAYELSCFSNFNTLSSEEKTEISNSMNLLKEQVVKYGFPFDESVFDA